jgi:5'-AMP-activated protein kinase regulatory beta subunit
VLPPHLRHIILNKVIQCGQSLSFLVNLCYMCVLDQPSSSVDALALPVPQPVSLNHLYCTAIKDGMMVLGVTERYKKKFITQVFYSTMPGSS